MEQNSAPSQPDEMGDFEKRLAQWRQSYQQHLQRLTEFRKLQKEFASQLLLREQQRIAIQDMQEDLKRVIQENAWRRATRP